MAGLREQKKQRTRRHISDVATAMFLERGFDEVTVAEVAEAAGCAKMTVFNYFRCKEDLLLDRPDEAAAELLTVIRERAATESLVQALRRYQHELLASGNPLAGIADARPLVKIVTETPSLLARMHEQRAELTEAIAEALSTEMSLLDAKIVAEMISATRDCLLNWGMELSMKGITKSRARAEQAKAIDRAFGLLEHGLAAR